MTPASTPGQYVLAAAEKIPEGSTYIKVVVAGAGFYGNYVARATRSHWDFAYNFRLGKGGFQRWEKPP
jgi:hypothetical protein